MNTRFLVFTSFFMALLCHLFIFNYLIIIFPIDPETPKPKLFFLGPILKSGDIKEISSKESDPKSYSKSNHYPSSENDATDMRYETVDPNKNPFTIQTIKKPLIPQTAKSEEKIILKSIFETQLEENTTIEKKAKPLAQELEIKPYKPLQFRIPKS